MRRAAPRIVYLSCPRCGRSVASLARPIHSSEATAAKWRGLCASCVTDAERAELLSDMKADTLRRIGGSLGADLDATLRELRRP